MEAATLFPLLSPGMARERFLVRDATWEQRFRPGFNDFICATFEGARSIIRLPVPPARTANHALMLVTAGHVALTLGHDRYVLTAGQLVPIPAGQIFSLLDISADVAGFLCFFSPEMLRATAGATPPDFLRLSNSATLTLPPDVAPTVTFLFTQLTREYDQHGAGAPGLTGPYLAPLLAELARQYAGLSRPPLRAADRLVQQFLNVLDETVGQGSRVADLAQRLHVTPNHLNKVVRAQTGRSPSVWMQERLVLEAKVWLFQSDWTVAQIAQELGFSDHANFGRLFRRYVGISPATYRRHVR